MDNENIMRKNSSANQNLKEMEREKKLSWRPKQKLKWKKSIGFIQFHMNLTKLILFPSVFLAVNSP
jgi:hypothetical protein